MATKTWNVGDVLAAADMNEWGGGSTGLLFASKAGDTSRTSNTTLANDPDLTVTTGANKVYEMEVQLCYTAGTTGAFKCDITAPSGYTFTGTAIAGGNFAGTLSVLVVTGAGLGGAGGFLGAGHDAGEMFSMRFSGVLALAGTGGAVTVRFAQQTSSGTSTILKTGSWMRLRRVA